MRGSKPLKCTTADRLKCSYVLSGDIDDVQVLQDAACRQLMQDFIAGAMQWYTRVMAWFLGLTDEYPPYGTQITPAA